MFHITYRSCSSYFQALLPPRMPRFPKKFPQPAKFRGFGTYSLLQLTHFCKPSFFGKAYFSILASSATPHSQAGQTHQITVHKSKACSNCPCSENHTQSGHSSAKSIYLPALGVISWVLLPSFGMKSSLLSVIRATLNQVFSFPGFS